jgi:hypothetical protein
MVSPPPGRAGDGRPAYPISIQSHSSARRANFGTSLIGDYRFQFSPMPNREGAELMRLLMARPAAKADVTARRGAEGVIGEHGAKGWPTVLGVNGAAAGRFRHMLWKHQCVPLDRTLSHVIPYAALASICISAAKRTTGIDRLGLDAESATLILFCMEEAPGDCHRHLAICGPHFPEAIHIFRDGQFTARALRVALESALLLAARGIGEYPQRATPFMPR